MYKILPYTLAQAKRLNVKVRPSSKADKKLDIYDRKGNFVTSVGAEELPGLSDLQKVIR
jgi:hypothetical protein